MMKALVTSMCPCVSTDLNVDDENEKKSRKNPHLVAESKIEGKKKATEKTSTQAQKKNNQINQIEWNKRGENVHK